MSPEENGPNIGVTLSHRNKQVTQSNQE